MENETKIITPIEYATLSQSDEIRVVFDFFQGTEKKTIAKNFNVSVKSVSTIVDKYRLVASRDILLKKLELDKARESDRLMKIKEKIYDLVENTIDATAELENPISMIENFTKIKDILGKMDEIFRLNNNMATQNIDTKTQTIKVDVAEIMKTLPTSEDKLRFLQSRATQQIQDN